MCLIRLAVLRFSHIVKSYVGIQDTISEKFHVLRSYKVGYNLEEES